MHTITSLDKKLAFGQFHRGGPARVDISSAKSHHDNQTYQLACITKLGTFWYFCVFLGSIWSHALPNCDVRAKIPRLVVRAGSRAQYTLRYGEERKMRGMSLPNISQDVSIMEEFRNCPPTPRKISQKVIHAEKHHTPSFCLKKLIRSLTLRLGSQEWRYE